jgi:hypothetical protein
MRAMLVATTSLAVAVRYEEASEVLEPNPAGAPQTAMDHFERSSANGWQAGLV